jgi:hypothetical protein
VSFDDVDALRRAFLLPKIWRRTQRKPAAASLTVVNQERKIPRGFLERLALLGIFDVT